MSFFLYGRITGLFYVITFTFEYWYDVQKLNVSVLLLAL